MARPAEASSGNSINGPFGDIDIIKELGYHQVRERLTRMWVHVAEHG